MVAVAVIALGVTGCGADDGDGGPGADLEPRPKGTGPLDKQVVRTDIETSTADAGAPKSHPDFSRMTKAVPVGSPQSCYVGYKGIGAGKTPVGVEQYDAVLDGLRAREWRTTKDQKGYGKDGATVGDATTALAQRDWTLVVELMSYGDPKDGVLTIVAYENRCVARHGALPKAIG
ncbi:hypothetical protein JNUCC64_17810 [Streptomyces sp. JNUCC 64]